MSVGGQSEQPKGNVPPNQAMLPPGLLQQGQPLPPTLPPSKPYYQDQFGNPNAYAAAAGSPPSQYGQEQAWAGDMHSTMSGAPPPGFDEGRAGGTWDSYKQKYADPYTAFFGKTGPVSVPGSGGWEPGTEGLPRGPNGNVDWSALSNPGDNTGTRRNDEPDTTGWASPADFSADATRMEDATFGRMRNLLSPVFDEQQRALENRLAVQGLPTGGEAYSRAYDTFNRGKSNAFENAALSAVGAGRQEQGRMFDQQSNYTRLAAALMGQDAAMQNAARTQGLNEALMQRQIPQQELAALLGIAPTQYPQFQPMGTFGMQAPDVMGALNAQQNRQAGSQNALTGGLFTLGASLLSNPAILSSLSSRYLKNPIGPVDSDQALEAVRKLPVERWTYKGDDTPHIGTYAEDFAEAAGVGNGVTINFIDALGLLTAAVKGLADRLDRIEARHE